MSGDLNSIELQKRLEEAERRLTAIAELASGEVVATGTPDKHLEDAEMRLNRIVEVAMGDAA